MKRNRSWNEEKGLNAERKEDGEKDRGRKMERNRIWNVKQGKESENEE
jgi:hypothetical protein